MSRGSTSHARWTAKEGRAASPRPMLPYDVRLRRELTHRRLAVSMVRRLLRVLSLHLVDGALLIGSVFLLARFWPRAVVLEPLVPVTGAIFLLSLNALSAYSPGDGRRDRKRLFLGVLFGLLILECLAVFPPRLPLDPPVLLALGGIAFVALALGRKATDQLVRQAYVRGIGLRRAVVIGNLEEAGEAIRQLRDEHNIDQYVVGHLTAGRRPDPAALGTLSRLPRVLDELDVQEVIIAAELSPELTRRLTTCCFERGVLVYVFPAVLGTVHCRAEPLQVGPRSLVHLYPARLELPALLVKRAFDLVLATVAVFLFAPVMIAVALAIRLNSPGPVFFRQQRVGVGGQPFIMWKFRSMVIDSDARKDELTHLNCYTDPRLFKMAADPRVTAVGRWLRRSSMDELPQLFNVIRGEMSLVGPRPPVPSEVDRYEPHHLERLSVVPGMTGPWQVGGRNLITDFERVVQMERAYIRSWSLLLDAKILLRTIKVVVRGEGAF